MRDTLGERTNPLPWYSGGGLGWGRRGFQVAKHLLGHRIRIFQNLIVPKPHDMHAQFLQPGRTASILLRWAILGVLPAVKFHRQTPRRTIKIQDVSRHGSLSAETITAQVFQSQYRPELPFGVGWLPPHVASEAGESRVGIARDIHAANVGLTPTRNQAPPSPSPGVPGAGMNTAAENVPHPGAMPVLGHD